ncbi:murein biosynthesis integral membrane protein MurJ [Jonesia quinghaiensis]|uniref:murein biosynthesis integral membrane protein MurJ n=1 Tax=Jonesia quinghaiensis TaxID=262806 RepID=UPI00041B3D61|nr:lipid II flippase MurJ [Jonesia quinghaiensis]
MSSSLRDRLHTLAGAAILISVITLASRLLGFGRWIAQASWVGTGGVAEPYAAANLLPNVLFEVVAGGALASVVIPLLTGAIDTADKKRVQELTSALLTWTLVALVPLAVVVVVAARPLLALTSDLAGSPFEDTAVFFLRVFAIQIPLYGVGIVAGGVLQAHKRFFWPAFAPMVSSLVVMVAYFLFDRFSAGQHADPNALSAHALGVLAWGTTAGVAAMASAMVGPMLSLRMSLRPRMSFPPGVARRARALAFAGVGALVAQQLTTVVVMKVATTVGDSTTLNVFQYGQAVYFLPYAVLVVPLATSAFPRITGLAQSGDDVGLRSLVSSTSRMVVVISCAGIAALAAGSLAVERFFDSFTKGGVPGMAYLLVTIAPSLLGLAAIFHLSRVLYARDNGRAAVAATATGWAIVTLVMVAGVMWPGVDHSPNNVLAIIGFSHSVGLSVAAVLLAIAVARECGKRSLAGVVRALVTGLIGATVGGGAGLAVSFALLDPGASTMVSVLVGLLAGFIALVTVGLAVAIIDRHDVQRLVRGRGKVT